MYKLIKKLPLDFCCYISAKHSEWKKKNIEVNLFKMLNVNKNILMEQVISRLPVPVMVVERTGDIIMCNPEAKRVFQCLKCPPSAPDEKNNCPIQLLLETLSSKKPLTDYIYQFYLNDDEEKILLINTELISGLDDGIIGAVLIAYDITERKKVYEQMQQAEKISMISELAAGVAHEIKNPLTTTRGLLQLLAERFAGDKTAYQHIRVALKETEIINSIIKEMMLLSQPSKPNLTFTQIENVLDEVSVLIDSDAVFNNVTMERIYQPNLPLAVMDVTQMKQVFLNLALNAIGAMPNGGVLTINVAYNEQTNEFEITFKDNGTGIAGDDMKKIFYPFYSGKNDNVGLGLTMCYQVVNKHGGYITVKSKRNKGSTFTVYLPVINQVQKTS
ncbi:nitrogen-specific signal transduction histidine kinase [Desulfohalotomaculum tongense]|uniref:two-component system sensor histidine kinase NtrB n=1 Tax=Desulforadius tongensis TaxID=1216062 RepID=UPI00195D1427|nr:ATP-binding protein [Desulforadius tongensis]MBM7855309.1 nitrogen-specific signal transduction histidine kinase [Desulforadius tongensis]